MAVKKRRFGFFDNDLFGEDEEGFFGFDDFFGDSDAFRELFEKMRDAHLEPGKPIVYGFSVTEGPNGKKSFREFGNVDREDGVREEREPLVDVIKGDCEITVVAELPGANKDEIKVRADEQMLRVEAEGIGERRYSKTIKLPAKVKKGSAKASFKNGILEVRLALAEPAKEKSKGGQPTVCGDEIKID